ncbi:acetate--CoA ligase family protein [Methylomonas sp. SURF-2]|uniref:Acetate--CoA ligase family protein n=1 Tax=Methylomonas subterranea TaxID=2952225 RepID=A0ABT1TCN5_9GAMM|nr:acetate--CoA ligase family protein [Methylomonas sp. SURF-2]MCQ8103229.1 acetate--CoA ligase family protein [Methylomonas sp. SURF-2]
MTTRDLFIQAVEHYDAGRLGKAQKSLVKLLNKAPNHEQARYYLGLTEQQLGRVELAAVHFKNVLDRNADEAAYWVAYVEALIALGDRQAVAVFVDAVRRGLRGEPAQRLEKKIREAFSPVERSLQVLNCKVLKGGRHGIRQPVLEARISVNTKTEIDRTTLITQLQEVLELSFNPAPLSDATHAKWLAQLLLLSACKLQQAAGHPIFSEGSLIELSANQFLLAIPYDDGDTAMKVLKWMGAVLNSMLSNPECALSDELKTQLQSLRENWKAAALGSKDMLAFLANADSRGLPWVNRAGFHYQFGYGNKQRWLHTTFTDQTSRAGAYLARNKTFALQLLRQAGLPVPTHILINCVEDALKAAKSIGYPVVVKPDDLDRALGVSVGINNPASLQKAYRAASEHSSRIAVENHVPGVSLRLNILGGRLLQATLIRPAGVTGNGIDTIQRLAARNEENSLTTAKLILDQESHELLAELNMTEESIPENGRFVQLKRMASTFNGGSRANVIDQVHPENVNLARRAAEAVGLDFAGVDILISDITQPWHAAGGVINEINAAPMFSATRPEAYAEVLDYLLNGSDGRIPIATIIGESSIIARMLHAIMLEKQGSTGLSCAQAVWLGEEKQVFWDWSGFNGGRYLLNRKQTDAAVMALTADDISQNGFPYDLCDVTALLNLPAGTGFDYELERVRRYVIVNADNPACLAQVDALPHNRSILVTGDAGNPQLTQHLESGQTGAWLAGDSSEYQLMLGTLARAEVIFSSGQLPTAPDVSIDSMAFSALFAGAIAFAMECSNDEIRQGLLKFTNHGYEKSHSAILHP